MTKREKGQKRGLSARRTYGFVDNPDATRVPVRRSDGAVMWVTREHANLPGTTPLSPKDAA